MARVNDDVEELVVEDIEDVLSRLEYDMWIGYIRFFDYDYGKMNRLREYIKKDELRRVLTS